MCLSEESVSSTSGTAGIRSSGVAVPPLDTPVLLVVLAPIAPCLFGVVILGLFPPPGGLVVVALGIGTSARPGRSTGIWLCVHNADRFEEPLTDLSVLKF